MYYDDYDCPPPRRMQPATKYALALIASCCGGLALLGAIALARNSTSREEETKIARSSRPVPSVRSKSATPAPRRTEPAPANEDDAESGSASIVRAADVGIFGVSMAVLIFLGAIVPLLLLATDILILAWVVRDARSRGLDGGIWALVVLLGHFLGLLVYLASRPSGILTTCCHCQGRRLIHLRLCPQCGREEG